MGDVRAIARDAQRDRVDRLATSPDEATWEPPEQVRGFQVLGPLGRGGMGRVYLARETALDRLVALKFMTVPSWVESAHERFLAEARALARLHHPNVVSVYRIDELDGRPFIAYEYVRGESLDKVLKPLRWQSALAIASGVAAALGAAHEAGLLHRDVKPANVVLAPSGAVKLLDFGLATDRVPPASDGDLGEPGPADARALRRSDVVPARRERGIEREHLGRLVDSADARLTAPGLALGTPRYWSPEQWRGAPATAATDVYAFGLLFYELVSGALPHAGLTGSELSAALAAAEAPPIDDALAPRSVLDVIRRCLRREPRERFTTGIELAEAVEGLAAFFAPRRRALESIAQDEDVVMASWSRLAESREALAARLFSRLFDTTPELRALFPRDLTAQRDKIVHVLDVTIKSLRTPERVAPMLRDLGRTHVTYGVDGAMLETFALTLRATLRELDPKWTEQLDAAWAHALAFLVTTMRSGMRSAAPSSQPAAFHPTPGAMSAPTGPLAPPRTAYAQVDGASVAYQVFGKGPPDLVVMPSLLSHVEVTWNHPKPVMMLEAFARFGRVALFDRRGSGLSDPLDTAVPTLEGVTEDIVAVLDAIGSRRAVLVGSSDASLAAIHTAAERPGRVQALVLVGGAPCFAPAPGYPFGQPAEFWDGLAAWMAAHWGDPMLVELQAPTASRDPTFTAWMASYYRMACSRGRAVASLRFLREANELASLAKIQAPALVVSRRDDPAVSVAQGDFLAAHLPRASHVVVEGTDHFLFANDPEPLAAEIERFVAGLGETELVGSG